MALTQAQIEFITPILELYLDFSKEKDQLIEVVASLKESLTSVVPKAHPFYDVHQMFIKPEAYFLRLEKFRSNELTLVSEVQEAVIEILTEKIQSATLNANAEWNELNWNKDSLISKLIPSSSKNKIFRTRPPVLEFENPWSLPDMPERIYQREMCFQHGSNPFFSKAFLNTTLTIDGVFYPLSVFLGDISNYESDSEIRVIKMEAEKKALSFAADAAFHYLSKQNATFEGVDKESIPKKLITTKLFFKFLEDSVLSAEEIIYLDFKKEAVLIHPNTLDLIENHLLSIRNAKHLNIKIINHPVYHNLLRNEIIKPSQLIDLKFSRVKFLVSPCLPILIQQKKITIEEALQLPLYLNDARTQIEKEIIPPMSVLGSSLYQDFFRNHTVDWQRLKSISKTQCRLILDKFIAALIVNGILKIEDSLFLTENISKKLSKLSEKLIKNGKPISSDLIKTFFKFPIFFQWAEKNLFDIEELCNGESLFNRIGEQVNIFYDLYLSEPPSPEKIKLFFENFPRQLKDSTFHDDVLENLIKRSVIDKLNSNLIDLLLKHDLSEDYKFLPDQTDWEKMQDALIKQAHIIHDKIRKKQYVYSEKDLTPDNKHILFKPSKKRKQAPYDLRDRPSKKRRLEQDLQPLKDLCLQIMNLPALNNQAAHDLKY